MAALPVVQMALGGSTAVGRASGAAEVPQPSQDFVVPIMGRPAGQGNAYNHRMWPVYHAAELLVLC